MTSNLKIEIEYMLRKGLKPKIPASVIVPVACLFGALSLNMDFTVLALEELLGLERSKQVLYFGIYSFNQFEKMI